MLMFRFLVLCICFDFVQFATGQTILFQDDFESSVMGTDWIQLTPNQGPALVNRWTINSNGCSFTNNSLHVTNNSGNCVYRNFGEATNIVAFAEVDGTTGTQMVLQFDYTVTGENGFDWGQVGYSLDGVNFVDFLEYGPNGDGTYSGVGGIRTERIPLPAQLDGLVFYIGFRWLNEPSGVGSRPFTIDNVLVESGGSVGYCSASGASCGGLGNCAQANGCGDNLNTWIKNFTLENVVNNDATCGTTSKGYSDFTSMVANVQQGLSYPFSFEAEGFIEPTEPMVCLGWVDWNDNGSFEDAERFTGGTADAATFNGTITVPPDAVVNKALRLRVRIYWYLNSPVGPCGSTSYGEVEDYSVFVAPLVGAGCPQNYDPIDGTINLCTWGDSLKWDSVPNVTEYAISLGTNSPDFNNVLDRVVVSGTALEIATALLPLQSYSWTVAPISATGDTASCALISFTTGPGNPQVDLDLGNDNFTCLGLVGEIQSNVTGGQRDYTGKYPQMDWTSSIGGLLTAPLNDTSVVITPTTLGVGWVYFEVTDSLGCFAEDSLSMEVVNPPSISISPDIQSGCEGSSLTYIPNIVDAPFSHNLNWSVTGLGTVAPYGTDSAIYSDGGPSLDSLFVILNMGQCSARDTVEVEIKPYETPSGNIVANPNFSLGEQTCFGSPVSIDLTGASLGANPQVAWFINDYEFEGWENRTQVDSNGFEDGDRIYAVVYSDYPCVSTPSFTTNSITVSHYPELEPEVQIEPLAPSFCENDPAQVRIAGYTNLSNPESYRWYLNGDVVSVINNDFYSVSGLAPGPHTVQVEVGTRNGCGDLFFVSSNTVSISILPSVNWDIEITGNHMFCPEQDHWLGVDIPAVILSQGVSYAWFQNGDLAGTGSEFNLVSSVDQDQIGVQVLSNYACAIPQKSDLKQVTVNALPIPEVNILPGNYFEWCMDDPLVLDVDVSGGTGPMGATTWYYFDGMVAQTGSGSSFNGISPFLGQQRFRVEVEDANGCIGEASTVFELRDKPEVDFTFVENEQGVMEFQEIAPDGYRFFWDFGDTEVAHIPNPHHIFPHNGTFEVCLQVWDWLGCENTKCRQVSVYQTVGIQGLEAPSEVRIFPNPTQGVLFVSTGKQEHVSVSVFTLAGKRIQQVQLEPGEQSWELPHELRGLFVVEIQTEQNLTQHKIVIE